MTVRRVINWVVTLSVGFFATIITIRIFDTTLERFSLGNAILVFLSIAAIVFIWLDFILKTDYLRN
ncbi:MAG: hypothetical protein PVH92_09105 [Anaerolineales bacterium]|jgi:hypothetical protein